MNILIVCGGRSVEEKISVITAIKIYNSLLIGDSYHPYLVYQDPQSLLFYGGRGVTDIANYQRKRGFKTGVFFKRSGRSFFKMGTKKIPFDLVFPVVHGANTEDGTMASYFITQGFLTLAPTLSASAIAQDKILFKDLLHQHKVKAVRSKPLIKSVYLSSSFNLAALIKPLRFPLIVKPYDLGSSIGIKVATTTKELVAALEGAYALTEKVLIEEYLKDRVELDIALIKGKDRFYFSAAEKITTDREKIYSYHDKYIDGRINRELPAKLNQDTLEDIKSTAAKVYSHLGLSGVVRFDFFLSGETIYLNEVNTIPGSYSANLFLPVNLSIKELLDIYLEESLERIKARCHLTKNQENSSFEEINRSNKLKL